MYYFVTLAHDMDSNKNIFRETANAIEEQAKCWLVIHALNLILF